MRVCADQLAKVRFVQESLLSDGSFFNRPSGIDRDLSDAIDWIASVGPNVGMATREDLMCQIERAGDVMWKDGSCNAWFYGSDPIVKKVRLADYSYVCFRVYAGGGWSQWAVACDAGRELRFP